MAPRRRNAVTRARRSPYEARFLQAKRRTAMVAARARSEAMRREEMLLSLGSAAAIGYAKKKGWNLPSVAGIDPTLLYGLVLGVGLPMVTRDKMAKRLEAAGTGLLTVGVYSFARTGTWSVTGGEGIHGDVEIVGDDDDDDDEYDI